MRVLFLGLNYEPESIGTGVYSTGLCKALAEAGHEVEVITAKPYYPQWQVFEEYRKGGYRRQLKDSIRVTHCPLFVPVKPTGLRRVMHHLSFAATAALPLFSSALSRPPDLVITVAPSLIAAPLARFVARMTGAKCWLHVQDLEVGAAFATGLLNSTKPSAKVARAFERAVITSFDMVSAISPEMCGQILAMNVPDDRVYELRNWADLEAVRPIPSEASVFRQKWDIRTPHVALYSGNIANKQGIEVVVDAARRLAYRKDVTFVICGEGPNRAQLEEQARGLENIRFRDLQPRAKLKQLFGLATIHLLPQRPSAADLVLPSKLGNMLASGKPVVATAAPQTGLSREVEGCGIVVEPSNPQALADSIERLMRDNELYLEASLNARERAIQRWSAKLILSGAISAMTAASNSTSAVPNTQPSRFMRGIATFD